LPRITSGRSARKSKRANTISQPSFLADALNDHAEEALAADDLFRSNFARPTVFMDPRRAMLSVRLNLGR
jgi:hypothetical protein